MAVDIQRLQDENRKSLEAVDNAITRLRDLSDDGLPLSQAIAVNAQLSRAQGDKIHLQIVRGHLTAAGVVVEPINPAVQNRLDELSARLDRAIQNDFVINATFDVVKVVLSAAEEIGDISTNHTA